MTRLQGVFFLVVFLAGCTEMPPPRVAGDADEDDLDIRTATTIAAHAESDALATWYATLPPNSPEHDAARWILAWLPPSDRVALDLITLQEHVAVACNALRTAPWRDQLPRHLWLHYVVPHRVSQEPIQPWRAVMARELGPVVADAATMEEAALAVNRWCRQQATYIATSGRDMGPLTTMKRGLGRCEEEMILAICAMRAAGLPARVCSTPYWTFTDDNHAWVEVWTDGQWHYAESCDDRSCLDNSWFSVPASRAGFVRSLAYGEFIPTDEALYRATDGVTVINSTAVYTDPFELVATVAGAPESDVYVNVLNYGTMRAIARVEPGRSLALGPGEYALTAADPESGDLLLRVVRGEPGGAVTARLDPNDRYDLEASPPFWLHYPEADARPLRQLELVPAAVKERHRQIVATNDALRRKARTLDPDEQALLDSLATDQRATWDEVLDKPLATPSTWVRLLPWAESPERRAALTAFLSAADDKDLLEWTERDVRAHVDGALAVRRATEDAWGLVVPDSVWQEGVLSGRIARELGCDWRSPLPSWSLASTPDTTLAGWLDRFADRIVVEPDGVIGQPLAPHQTWRTGSARTTDLEVCFVGLCRRAGVPARWRHGKVEVWTGAWREVQPVPDQDDAEATTKTVVTGSGWIEVTLTRGDLPEPAAEIYRHFMIAEPDDGVLKHRWWDVAQGVQTWDAGRFVLGSVTRVPGGSACGRLRSFEVVADDTTRVTLALDIDPAGWDPSVLVDGELEEPLLAALAESGEPMPDGCFLLVGERGEALVRSLKALGRVWPRLEHEGIAVRIVVVGEVDRESWALELDNAKLPQLPTFTASPAMERFLAGPAGNGPVTALMGETGRWSLLRSGLDNDLDQTIHLALEGSH